MVRLEPMSEDEYQTYLSRTIPEYAAEHVRGGRWSPEEALEKSAEEYRGYLPQGLATPKQHLFSIKEETTGDSVGMLWFSEEQRGSGLAAFVYDVWIDERFRRRGYAEQAFQALERLAGDMGLQRIELHVFGHNQPARALYQKLGYAETNVIMAKTIAATSQGEEPGESGTLP